MDHVRLIDIALHDPVEEVQVTVAATLLEEAPHLANALQTQVFGGREPVEALADGGGGALVAVQTLARTGGMADVAALRGLTEHPSPRMQEAVSEALAAIRMRIGDQAQGGVTLATPTEGRLSEARRAEAAKTPVGRS